MGRHKSAPLFHIKHHGHVPQSITPYQAGESQQNMRFTARTCEYSTPASVRLSCALRRMVLLRTLASETKQKATSPAYVGTYPVCNPRNISLARADVQRTVLVLAGCLKTNQLPSNWWLPQVLDSLAKHKLGFFFSGGYSLWDCFSLKESKGKPQLRIRTTK